MKYKVGDKVRIRKDLVENQYYGFCIANFDMLTYGGKSAKIMKVCRNGFYLLESSNNEQLYYLWTDEMLENI